MPNINIKVSKIEETHTLQEFINISNSIPIKLDHRSFCMIEKRDGVEYPIYNVLDDYMIELKNSALNIVLTPVERETYMYQPKLLSHKIYGTTLFYHVILKLNNLCNVHEFTIPNNKLLLLPKSIMIDSLNKIYSAESTAIKYYNNKHQKDTTVTVIEKKRV